MSLPQQSSPYTSKKIKRMIINVVIASVVAWGLGSIPVSQTIAGNVSTQNGPVTGRVELLVKQPGKAQSKKVVDANEDGKFATQYSTNVIGLLLGESSGVAICASEPGYKINGAGECVPAEVIVSSASAAELTTNPERINTDTTSRELGRISQFLARGGADDVIRSNTGVVMGIDGAKGDIGPIGPIGEQGEVGPQGDQGVAGLNGSNVVSSAALSSNATISLGGSPSNALLRGVTLSVNEAGLTLSNIGGSLSTTQQSLISISNLGGNLTPAQQAGISLNNLGGTINLSTQTSGVLTVANGGTGLSTAPANGSLLMGTGSGYASVAPGTNGQVLVMSGGVPTYTTLPPGTAYFAGTGLTLTRNTFSITPSGVTAATYGSATLVPQFTVDATGRITGVTEISVAGGSVTSVFGRTGVVAATSGDYTTTQVTEGTNLYYTTARFDTALATKTTTNLTEGANLYYTDLRARLAVSVSGLPLTYNSGTGVLGLNQANISQAGFLSSADWNTFDTKENTLTFTGNGLFSRSGNTVTGNNSCISGQTLSWDGTAWVCAASLTNTLASGTVFVGNGSNQATGVAISGDATLSNTGALTIANNAITTIKIVNDAVTSAKILDGTIVNADISATAAIDYSKLNLSNSIVNGDIVNGTITNAKLVNSTIALSRYNGYRR